MKTIELVGVSKKYKKNNVLDNINYNFESGKCYMIVGANGAGKSTLLGLISKMIYCNKGFINLNGLKIGYVPDKNVLPNNITVKNFLLMLGQLKNENEENIVMLMKYFNMYQEQDKKIYQLSKGMIQKVLIIQAFIGNPDVLIFDEALNGLDEIMQKKLINLIKIFKNMNKIVLITSHYPSYYENIIDVRLKIENGKIN